MRAGRSSYSKLVSELGEFFQRVLSCLSGCSSRILLWSDWCCEKGSCCLRTCSLGRNIGI